MRRTLLAATIAIVIPTTTFLATPAFSTQSGDSLPVEVPKKDPSTWDCKRLDRHLAKNEKTKETTEIDLDELIQDLKEDTPKVEKAKKELKTAEASLTSTTDKAEKKQIKKEIRKKKTLYSLRRTPHQ